MTEAGVYIRSATNEDAKEIRDNIRHTLASPDTRGPRRRYEEATARNELLVMERYEPRERAMKVVGFVEWHTRVDGTATLRDAGTTGDEPQPVVMKRLLREMLRLVSPTSMQVKVREDLHIWNQIFADVPGFQLEGREYSRPYWKNIWTWSRAAAESVRREPPPRRRRRFPEKRP